MFILSACGSESVMPHKTPEVKDTEKCEAAEQHLKELTCIPTDKPYTKRGKSFTQFCQETQNAGVFINPVCLSEVKSCDEVDCCTNSKVCK